MLIVYSLLNMFHHRLVLLDFFLTIKLITSLVLLCCLPHYIYLFLLLFSTTNLFQFIYLFIVLHNNFCIIIYFAYQHFHTGSFKKKIHVRTGCRKKYYFCIIIFGARKKISSWPSYEIVNGLSTFLSNNIVGKAYVVSIQKM